MFKDADNVIVMRNNSSLLELIATVLKLNQLLIVQRMHLFQKNSKILPSVILPVLIAALKQYLLLNQIVKIPSIIKILTIYKNSILA
jgi:hypothetical protein